MIQRFRICLACSALVAISSPTQAQELPAPCINCAGGFVSSGAASYITSGNVATIDQRSERAILNWQSFNIGPDGSVVFQQPSATSAALNRIFQDDPVRILGSLTANGQVYLINPNGIVFGQGAQVNVRGLVASTLDVSNDAFLNLGITGAIRAGNSVESALPAFEGESDAGVHLANGARIKVGERVMLIGAEVRNEGTIEAPDGQAILAASHDTVYLAEDAELRGLLIEVGTGGVVENLGTILTERGNTTLVGLAVNQSGRISASTSVNVNGSIRLLARDGARVTTEGDARVPVAQRTGEIVLGEGGTTEIQLSADGETAVDGQPQQRSRVEAVGRTVHVQSGAQVLVPGGAVEITATSNPEQVLTGSDREARIFLDEGSLIDVSGDTSATIAMERNQATIRLFGNELADAPVQRDGPLARQPITVDLRRGTPLTDISPLLDQVRRTVGERMSAGGTVSLRAEGDVVVDTGATIDISGGHVEYLPGQLSTTQLVSNGRTVDISDADPLLQYEGIVNTFTYRHEKWGVTESWVVRGGQFEAGYVEGKDAGRVLFETRGGSVALAGDIRSDTVRGGWQREPASSLAAGLARPYTEMPLGGALEIVGLSGDVLFQQDTTPQVFAFETVLPHGLATAISPGLFATSGVSRFSVSTGGRIEIPVETQIVLDAGGSFAATGHSVRVAGDIRIQSGNVALTSTADADEAGQIEIASTAHIDVAGGWINETALANDGVPTREAMFVDGGQIDLASQGNLSLARGSRLNVSAGAALLANEDVRFGKAGGVSLASVLPDETFEAPVLTLDGELSGFGFKQGGDLEIRAAGFQVARGVPPMPSEEDAFEPPMGYLMLSPEFFLQGGFANFSLVGDRGDIDIASGTQILLRPQNLRLQEGMFRQRSGADIAGFSERLVLLEHERGTSSFSASVEREAISDVANAVVRIGSGSRIETEIGGSISLTADTSLSIDGALVARGGEIDIKLVNPNSTNEAGYVSDQAIRLESGALLDVSGGSRLFVSSEGERFGEVLDGGKIALEAERGYVFAASESRLDISGTTETLSLPSSAGGLTATAVHSAAGTLEVKVAEGGSLAGSINAHGGGGTSSDGSLRVTIDARNRDREGTVGRSPVLPQFPVARREIVIGNSATVVGSGATLPPNQTGRLFLSADLLSDAGFDSIDLIAAPFPPTQAQQSTPHASAVRFNEGVALRTDRRINVSAAIIESAAGVTTLEAPHVALGEADASLRSQPAVSQPGNARLIVNAQHLDLNGSLTLSGFGSDDEPGVVLNSSGDIRMSGARINADPTHFRGSLNTSSDVMLRASRIYPSTLTHYDINVAAAEGRIIVEGSGDASTPLSAAGRLTLSAATIEQGGTLMAPFGAIELQATDGLVLRSGSVTSVSGAGSTTPFGITEFGQSWIYPLQDKNLVLEAAPDRRVELQAPQVEIAAGALVDLSGGGDLLTYEFVKGPGGLHDILLADNPQGAFAIVPGGDFPFGVFDPLESSGAGIQVGDTIHLSGGGGVPAGEYVRLPARYALLPGAFLITPIAGTRDISPATPQFLVDGATPVVAGRLGFAGNDTASTRWSGFAIETADRVRERAEFNVLLASAFFSEDSRARTADAGSLVIDADRGIRLNGSVAASAEAGGRGATVDVIADHLAVVNERTEDATRVELVAAELANFADASIMLGGVRARDEETVALDVQAQSVTFEAGTKLEAAEIILAARDEIVIEQGVGIDARGAADDTGPEEFRIEGDGAFVRVTTAAQAAIERTGASGQAGLVNISAGATLRAARSINVEASGDVQSAGDLVATGGSLSLTASSISLGETSTETGLVLTNADLARFQARELQLNSRSTIDVYGAVSAEFDSVRFDAAGLRGLENEARSTSLTANTITLANSRGAAATSTDLGAGQLTLDAVQIELDEGSFEISGFDHVLLRATDQVIAIESGALRSSADLTIETSRITAESAVDVELVAGGLLETLAMTSPSGQAPTTALGASLSMTGASIDHRGRIELASGLVALEANGADGLVVRSGSSIDVSGRDVTFDDIVVGSSGGEIKLSAADGSVRVEDAMLDVSAASAGGDAGRISIDAPTGSLSVGAGANLRATARDAAQQGTFIAEIAGFEGSFSALNATLNSGGFTQRRDVSVREGDLILGAADSIVAQRLNLATDGGSIVVGGHIDARSASGGEVRLSAAGDVRVSASGRIDAGATSNGNDGGRIELATTLGTIEIAAAPGAIDVAGRLDHGARSETGIVHLRAPRVGTNNVAIGSLATESIAGAKHVDVEAVRVYESLIVDELLMGTIAADTDAYMANASAIETALGVATDDRFRLIAGEEVQSEGDLMLSGSIDLASRRYDGAAGVLTLRAGGELRLEGRLSDGLQQQEIVPEYPRDVVQTGESWSYRLLAGARLQAADVLATNPGAGDVRVGSGAIVRTGTGRVDIGAGHDVLFDSGFGAIYTVGENRGTGVLSAEDAEIALKGDFLERGGDIHVRARGSVRGVTDQFMTDYLPRMGEFGFWEDGRTFPFAIAVDVERFQQGIGALAGGDVTIDAGGDIESLAVTLPTNVQAGANDGSIPRVAGGGNLSVRAGGSIKGGNYLLGAGAGVLSAGASIARDRNDLAPTLQIGDAAIALRARNDVEVGTAFNPGVIEQDGLLGIPDLYQYFRQLTYAFTYTDASAITAEAVAGDLVLSTRNATRVAVTPSALAAIYPGNLSARSLRGSIEVDGQIDLFPAPNGVLELLAHDSVLAGSTRAGILQSDADLMLLPSLAAPATTPGSIVNEAFVQLATHAATPVHIKDGYPVRIVAQNGDIGSEEPLTFSLAEQARLFAGNDIVNLNFVAQHSGSEDMTVIRSGRDIIYPQTRGLAGFLTDASTLSIAVNGPGRADLIAGRDVTFGTSAGFVTGGNTANPALPESGADATVVAGLKGDLPLDRFVSKYLADDSDYLDELATFVARFPGDDSQSSVERFRALGADTQREFIISVFFNELRESGTAAVTGGDFSRGFAAIETLFPNQEYDGDLSSFLSRISTLDGGDINLLVPGGLVNAGVASSGSLSRPANLLGIVAQREGDVNGFVKGDFQVNASRVFALDGGDVLLWSSEADIDAGRGAKSALALPPPVVTFRDGVPVVDFPPAVSGSGIRTAVRTVGRKPGDVYLFAPAGVVDAGDAGIESAGNITVAATEVIGADNITVGGTSVGVPVDTGGLGASLTGVSAASSSATNSATAADDVREQPTEKAPLAQTALSWLEVFVVGLGEEGCKQDDVECLKRQTID